MVLRTVLSTKGGTLSGGHPSEAEGCHPKWFIDMACSSFNYFPPIYSVCANLIFCYIMAVMDEGKKDKQSKGRRFYRSRRSRIISGFCGGVGEYFDIDPILIRLGFLALFICLYTGLGLIIFYIVGSIVTPVRPEAE